MRLHRFYVPRVIGKDKEIVIRDSSLFNQLKNVFRFTIGGQVVILDNTGYEYHAMISKFGFGEVTFSIISRKLSKNVPRREVELFCSLVKKDKFEWILEKGTELGVSRFTPIISDRTEKKDFNQERAQRIIKEASEQSERAVIPTLGEIISFDQAIIREISCLAFDPKGDVFTIENIGDLSPVGIFIGPEGGWTEREIFLFKKNKIKVYSLGHFVLRAETAAIAIASLLLI